VPSRFILNEFNLNLASARLLVRFYFLLFVVIVARAVVGVLIVDELIGGRGVSSRVGPFGRVVLHLGLLGLSGGGIGRVWVDWRDGRGRRAAKGHTKWRGKRGRVEEGRGGEGGMGMGMNGQERGRAVKGRGDERGKGGKWGEGQMRTDRWRERPFGSSEGVEIGSLFQQQPLIYIQNFPRHTPKQSHTSIPRRLSPDASVQLSPYPAQIRCSGALARPRPNMAFPPIEHPQPQHNKVRSMTKQRQNSSHSHRHPSLSTVTIQ
jgi:hypothetical protein